MASKFLKAFIVILVIVIASPFLSEASNLPKIKGASAILICVETGRVLYEKNPHKRLPQASTTKITTAILALEKGNLNDDVYVSKEAEETGGSSIWLEEGEVFSLEQMLYALLLSSANDASVAIAEHIAGSEEEFVRMMNKKVREIGARDTHYANAHGLNNENQYSTAYDLALIAKYSMDISKFKEIVGTDRKVIPWRGNQWSRLLINKNKLIREPDLYPDADGIKTGYTRAAGRCLVGSATRDGMSLISVVLDSPGSTYETIDLLDYGFENFSKVELVKKGELIFNQKAVGTSNLLGLEAAESLNVVIVSKEKDEIKKIIATPRSLNPTVDEGEVLGQVIYTLNGEVLDYTELKATEALDSNSWFISIWQSITRL